MPTTITIAELFAAGNAAIAAKAAYKAARSANGRRRAFEAYEAACATLDTPVCPNERLRYFEAHKAALAAAR